MGGGKGLLFGKKYRAPHKRRQQVYSGKSSPCGARFATFSHTAKASAHLGGRAGGLIPPAPPIPAVPPAATFAGGATAAPVPRRSPAPAALRAALPGETTCCRFGCFSAFRWLFHLPPCSTPTGITGAPAARAEIPLPSFYRGDAAVPRRGWERGPPAKRRAMSGGPRRTGHRDGRNSSGAPGR